MPYHVKPVHGESRVMELSHIHDALKSGAITEQWLVRDERQDFWYSVGKLVGTVTSQPLTLFCPRCQSPIRARRIDIGLPAACPKCGTQIVVPDPDAIARRQRDEHLLIAVRQRAVFSGLALAGGSAVTLFSYCFRAQQGGWILWWGPMAFGLGTFLVCFPQYLQLKRKLRRK